LTRYGTWREVNILALKVALNSALISASCFTTLTETTFAPKPEVALRQCYFRFRSKSRLRVYCVAVAYGRLS